MLRRRPINNFYAKFKMGTTTIYLYFKFCVMISVFCVVTSDKDCEKDEFVTFYTTLADILAKRDRSGVLLPLREFKEDWYLLIVDVDRKSVYECGEILLTKMRGLDAKNETALTEEEKTKIQDEYNLLVSWVAGCGTVELWAGEKNGGTIASAIFHYVGGNPADVIGPKNEDDSLTNIEYPK